MTIATLNLGHEATITGLTGPEETRLQLQELGFTPGSIVKFVARSPFRDPVAFEVKGTTIALRQEEASCILV